MADDTPLLDTLAAMTAASLENSSLEPRELMLARIAALAASDAPPLSYWSTPVRRWTPGSR